MKYSLSFKSKEWNLPNQIKQSSKEIQSAFLRGLADSEAHVRYRKGQSEINICSGNKSSLEEIRTLLNSSFNILTYKGTNGTGIPVIVITKYDSLKRYNDLIGFTVNRKQQALRKALGSYKRKGLNRYPEDFKLKAVTLLNNGYSHREVSKILNTNRTNIYDWEKKYSN